MRRITMQSSASLFLSHIRGIGSGVLGRGATVEVNLDDIRILLLLSISANLLILLT